MNDSFFFYINNSEKKKSFFPVSQFRVNKFHVIIFCYQLFVKILSKIKEII